MPRIAFNEPSGNFTESRIISATPSVSGRKRGLYVQASMGRENIMDIHVTHADTAEFLATLFTRAAKLLKGE